MLTRFLKCYETTNYILQLKNLSFLAPSAKKVSRVQSRKVKLLNNVWRWHATQQYGQILIVNTAFDNPHPQA